MRVTADMMVTQSVRRLSKRMEGYERVQTQVATGKKFLKPSQQPADANTAMSLRAAKRSRAQEQRAAADAESWLNVADAQMQSAVDRLHRLRNLTVGAGTNISRTARDAAATEMRVIQSELQSIANTRHNGRPLFGGFADTAPVTKDEVTGVWTIADGGDKVMRRVGEQDEVRINVTAAEAFGANGDNVFTMIDDVIEQVEMGTVTSNDALDRIDGALKSLLGQLGRVGATTNRVESAMSRNASVDLAITEQLAETEDVDIAEAVMELQIQQVGFEATLKAVGMALPPSLVKFL